MSLVRSLLQKSRFGRRLLKSVKRPDLRRGVDQKIELIEQKISVSTQMLEARIDNIYKSLLRQEKISKDSQWTTADLEDIIALDLGNLTIRELRERVQAEHDISERSLLKTNQVEKTPLQLQFDEHDGDLPAYVATHIARFEKSFDAVRAVYSSLSNAKSGVLDIDTHACYHPELRKLFGDNVSFIGSYNPAYQSYPQSAFKEINLEKAPLPYEDASFDLVLMFEVIEHLYQDPMYVLAEINRVLRPGGYLIVSTPNVISWRSVLAILTGYHPYRFGVFTPGDYPHVHEFTPEEISIVLKAAGFSPRVYTEDVYAEVSYTYLPLLIQRLRFQTEQRGDTIFATARKIGPVQNMRPPELY